MSPKVFNYKTSPRSCLLLKTLLFLLCIYIKRVTAFREFNLGANKQGELAYFPTKTAIEGETALEINCPWKDLVKQKENLTQPINQTYLNQLRKDIILKTEVIWLKDNQILHRMNGNPVLHSAIVDQVQDPDKKSHILLYASLTDTGAYTCVLNYTQIPKPESYKYFDLYPKASFGLEVIPSNAMLPDMSPSISHPPNNITSNKGANVTFTCNRIETLSHQTTYWFKSCSKVKESKLNENCTDQFLIDYNNAVRVEIMVNLYRYLIRGQHSDELHLFNVSDKDIAYYGCVVTNEHGVDIRLGRLDLVESRPPENPSSNKRAKVNEPSSPIPDVPSIQRTVAPSTNLTLLPTTVNPGRDNAPPYILWSIILVIVFLFAVAVALICSCKLPSMKDKKQSQSYQNILSPIVGMGWHEDKLRQHLPKGDYPDIYSARESSSARFISGHHNQGNGPLMAQSISSHLLDKEKNPSISSNSDEASSWGKSTTSNGDNSRAFYLHTSNNTSTTVPMYDHPPSTGTMRGDVIQGCVINPTYGLLALDPDPSDWIFPRRNLERLNQVGEGQFGEVWRYKARQKDGDESYVAVKQLKNRADLGCHERLEFKAEIEIMKCVNDHPNVIKLLNYCIDNSGPMLLIMEFAEKGKLQTYLRKCRSNSLNCLSESSPAVTSKELVEFSYHIAKGMEYVASKGIIHRDLASRNILVSKDKICKVADFGFARRVSDDCAYERTTANPVPVKWMAPEALVENKFTSKSDVFSFGILMWEIVTLGATPYEYMTSPEVYKIVTEGERLERPVHCKKEFYGIMEKCWSHDPVQRPTFKELASQLEKLLLSENDYIELDQYPEHAYYNILNTAEKEIVNIEPIE